MPKTHQYLTVHILPDENVSDVTTEGYKKLYALLKAAENYLNANTAHDLRNKKMALRSRIEESRDIISKRVTLTKKINNE